MDTQVYAWKAVGTDGEIRRGVWECANSGQLRTRLREEGYYPLDIKPKRTSINALWHVHTEGLNRQDWLSFTRRLSSVLQAGIPLLTALEIITNREFKGAKQRNWLRVKERVATGEELSRAVLAASPPPPLFVQAMIKSGEQTGNLAKALAEVSDDLEKEYAFQQKIKAALAYPLLLLVAALGVIYFLGVFVLPMYENLYDGLGSELPYLTRVIFMAGREIPLVLGLILGGLGGTLLFLLLTNPSGWRDQLDDFLRGLPVVGTIRNLRGIVQLSHILGRLLHAGIPLLEALHLTSGTIRDREMQQLLVNLILGVRQGKRLTATLRLSRFFPVLACEMIAVGEETGRLDEMFAHVAKMYRQELEEKLEHLAKTLEPVLILGLAGLIGVIAVGVLLPLFNASTYVQ